MFWFFPKTIIVLKRTITTKKSKSQGKSIKTITYQSLFDPHRSVAQWDTTRGTAIVWSSTQVPH